MVHESGDDVHRPLEQRKKLTASHLAGGGQSSGRMRHDSSQHLIGEYGGHVVDVPHSPDDTDELPVHMVAAVVIVLTGAQSCTLAAHDWSLHRTGRMRGQVTSCGQSAMVFAHENP